ncbi:hypothetical protein ACWERJ_35175, partial [Streptomyces sp. NPDC004050]
MTYGERPGGGAGRPPGRHSGAPPVERPVERRLRAALDARATSVTVRELRPAAPPGPHSRRPAAVVWLRSRR